MTDTNVIKLSQPGTFTDSLTEILFVTNQTTACSRAEVGSNTVRGELAIQRGSSRRILVFGRSYRTRTMMQ